MEIDIHFVCDKVQAKEINIDYVPSLEHVVVLLTQPLTHYRFIFLHGKLGMSQIPSHLRGLLGEIRMDMSCNGIVYIV